MPGAAIAKQPPLAPVVDLATTNVPAPAGPATTDLVQMIERLAANPDVDVAKLEKLIAMKERVEARDAEAAFNVAFLAMQPDIPEITEKGAIRDKFGNVQSKYALNEDIQQALRPILRRHGFTLSFRTEWPAAAIVKVVGILTHNDGHARTSEFQSIADTSGSKNAIQALGSAVSYGHRYTTIDLLNLTSRGRDDDGQGTDMAGKPDAPAGYESWFDDMVATSEEGVERLQAAFEQSPLEYRKYLTKTNPKGWASIKKRAAEARS